MKRRVPLRDALLVADPSPSPYELVLLQERGEALDRALRELPARQQAVLRLYFFEGLTFEQCAPLLNVSRSRIGQIKDQALRMLRGDDALAEFFGQPTRRERELAYWKRRRELEEDWQERLRLRRLETEPQTRVVTSSACDCKPLSPCGGTGTYRSGGTYSRCNFTY
jgi:predicted DNA-binding protein YlxM (UPF0122 family)